ncbi:hypothetical protein V6N13_096118 [Hibiscus sabdariffa]
MESTQNFEFVVTTADDRELREVDAVSAVAGAKQIDATNNEESTPFTKRKRKKTSGFWNFFVCELFGIKEVLDAVVLDGSDCMRAMEMKRKFDKYWDTYNLLISIGVVLDPRIDGSQGVSTGSTSMSGFSSLTSRFGKCIKTGTAKYDQHIRSVDSFTSVKSELDIYLEDGIYIGTKMVDMLICGADWYSQYYGLEKNKQNDDIVYVELLRGMKMSELVQLC